MYKIKKKRMSSEKTKTLDNAFDFAKYNLQDQTDDLMYNAFLNTITKVLGENIHEHYSALEVFKLSILINILKKKAEKYGVPHKLNTLLEVLDTSTVIVAEEMYENKPLSVLLKEMQSMEEKDLEMYFKEMFPID